MVEIDYREIDPATLDNLLFDIVIRAGTDYGQAEQSAYDKQNQLYRQLVLGKAVIVYHEQDGFCDVMSKSMPVMRD